MSEWKEYYLSDVYTISSGLSKPAESFGSGFPFLSFKEVFNSFFVPEKLSELVESTEKERLQCSIKKGDVFLTRTSETVKELGMSCVALRDYENATYNGFTKRLRPKKTVEIVPEYAGYYFRSSKFRKEVTSMSSASTRASLNIEMIDRLKIILPSKPEQSSIALILKNLDDKIENLRKQNETLEEIARSIFKHWFIDFEFPNADGKPYKSSGGVMVRSELGDIPKGWHVGKLGDVISVNPRESVKKGENIKFVDMRSLSTSSMEITDYIYKESASGSKFRNDDTLLARITPCLENGKTAFVSILEDDEVAVGSTEFLVLRAKNNCCSEYVYALARNPYFRDFAIKNMTGSSGRQRIPTDIVLNYKLPIPNTQVMGHYQKTCCSLFLKTGSNQKQIQTLIKTRDALLPKLMSGQLRVKE
jgi:type I restriction enzyme, S subunit